MTEKMKKIYDSILNNYTKIDVLQKIINDKKRDLLDATDLEARMMELEILIEILEKDVQTCKVCKEKDEKIFSKLFLNYYKTSCEFKDDYIIFDCENIDIHEKYYRDILKKYWHLLRTQGFDSEDEFSQIIQNYNEICASNDFFASFNARNFFQQKLGIYNELRWEYMKFIDALKGSTTRILDPDTIQYILDNTILIHLAYTNNKHKIVGYSSNNRLFLCQFHCENTPSMRVSITKNFFNCFGCGNCGNQIDYVKDYENVSYDQAAYLLAEVYLIDIPDNPYKEVENRLLVKKYRDVLISDEYKNFLISEYNKMNKSLDLDKVYKKIFAQIDRIKSGKYDVNFSYHVKSKKYKYYVPKNK